MWFVPMQTTCTSNPHATPGSSHGCKKQDGLHWGPSPSLPAFTLSTLLDLHGAFADLPGPGFCFPDTHWYSWHTISQSPKFTAADHVSTSERASVPWGPQEDQAGNKDSDCGHTALLGTAIRKGFLFLTCPHQTLRMQAQGAESHIKTHECDFPPNLTRY